MLRRRPVAMIFAALAFALAALAACLPVTVAQAQEPATSGGAGVVTQAGAPQPAGPSPGDHMRVGAPERPPFATRPGGASWQGIAVDLWRMIAEDLGVTYEIVPVPAEELPQALAAGQIDVALAVNATPGIEALIDLTAPLYTSTLAVASRREVVLWDVASNVLSIEFLQVMVSLSVLLLVVGAIVWLLERKQNSKEFHTRPLLGLGDGFWWAGVTLTTIGYGDKAPKTLLGRAVAMVWMLIGLAVSAALTAAVVSATNIEGNTGLAIGDADKGHDARSDLGLGLIHQRAQLLAAHTFSNARHQFHAIDLFRPGRRATAAAHSELTLDVGQFLFQRPALLAERSHSARDILERNFQALGKVYRNLGASLEIGQRLGACCRFDSAHTCRHTTL